MGRRKSTIDDLENILLNSFGAGSYHYCHHSDCLKTRTVGGSYLEGKDLHVIYYECGHNRTYINPYRK